MSKYEPLTRYLAERREESWSARFADVERILGFALPPSAYRHPAWWANQDRGHSQTRSWRDAGWETCNVDLAGQRLMFARSSKRQPVRAARSKPKDLLQRAKQLTGITDENQLLEAALGALLQQRSAEYLASLGGSLPDAEAAPRRRLD